MTSSSPSEIQTPLERLIGIMARLRDPIDGCAWDLQQSFTSIAPYTVEEAYEVADAIERGDLDDLKDELGDLLFQVVFHARMAQEQGCFDFNDVAAAICEKMVRRHPHIFADAIAGPAVDQASTWDDIKAGERAAKGRTQSLLDDVPTGMPALTRAVKLSKRVARVGFVWPTTDGVLNKLHEEVEELEHEIRVGDMAKAREELGDLLFVCANLGRDLGIDPEDALHAANAKFTRRFQFIEAALQRDGRSPEHSDLAEMEILWTAAKAEERQL